MSALRDGDRPAARAALDEAVDILRASGDRFGLANALYDHGRVLVAEGERDRGRAALVDALHHHASAGDLSGVAFVLEALSGLAAEEAHPARAVRLAAAATPCANRWGPGPVVDHRQWDVRAAVRGDLSEDAVEAAWAEGREMGLERVLTYVEGG